ncbi:MAG TPA: hypothetical protein VG122_11275 [Gemmata sp.]|nr:hypothetical protein [Gemmata sp.]
MRRSLVTLIAFMALAAWAGAQGPPPPLPAATQAKLFKSNRKLLENLVNHGIELAKADSPLRRAEECRKTAKTLANSLERAAEDQDPDRVAELARLVGDVVREGLVPNLNAAQLEIQPGDPLAPQLVKVRELATGDLISLPARIPTDGKVGDSQKVKEAIAAIQALQSSLGKP